MNSTFVNPSLGFPCEKCDFIVKYKSGIHLYLKAQHKESSQNESEISEMYTHFEPDDVVDEEPVYIQEYNCVSLLQMLKLI